MGRRLALAEKGYDNVEIAGVIADVRSRGLAEPAHRPWCMCPTSHAASGACRVVRQSQRRTPDVHGRSPRRDLVGRRWSADPADDPIR